MISKAARRYSNALYSLAAESNKVDELAGDFRQMLALIDANRELELFFHTPAVSKMKKRAVVNEMFKGRIGTLSYNFLELLISRSREALTHDIMTDFLNLKKEKEGIVDVNVKTAVELTDSEKSALEQKINAYTGKKSELKFGIDKEIIGGFVAGIGDTVLDASIRRQLEMLREKFKSGEFSSN